MLALQSAWHSHCWVLISACQHSGTIIVSGIVWISICYRSNLPTNWSMTNRPIMTKLFELQIVCNKIWLFGPFPALCSEVSPLSLEKTASSTSFPFLSLSGSCRWLEKNLSNLTKWSPTQTLVLAPRQLASLLLLMIQWCCLPESVLCHTQSDSHLHLPSLRIPPSN